MFCNIICFQKDSFSQSKNASIIKPTSKLRWRTIKQQKELHPKIKENKKGKHDHGYSPWTSRLVSIIGTMISKEVNCESCMSCTPPIYRELVIVVTNENHSLLSVP